MKRSEAVIKLAIQAGLNPLKALEVMEVVEKELGMMPPFSQFFRQEDVVDRWGIGTGQKEYVRLIINEWEQE